MNKRVHLGDDVYVEELEDGTIKLSTNKLEDTDNNVIFLESFVLKALQEFLLFGEKNDNS